MIYSLVFGDNSTEDLWDVEAKTVILGTSLTMGFEAHLTPAEIKAYLDKGQFVRVRRKGYPRVVVGVEEKKGS